MKYLDYQILGAICGAILFALFVALLGNGHGQDRNAGQARLRSAERRRRAGATPPLPPQPFRSPPCSPRPIRPGARR